MPSIDKDPGLQQAEQELLANLNREQRKLFLLWFKLERLIFSIQMRQQHLDDHLNFIGSTILDSADCEVNLNVFEQACWAAHGRIEAYHLKLEQEKEVLEERFDEVLKAIKSHESKPGELTWYLWCKAGYMDMNNDRYRIKIKDHRASKHALTIKD